MVAQTEPASAILNKIINPFLAWSLFFFTNPVIKKIAGIPRLMKLMESDTT